ncbi:MAG TPA: hypothetical protein VFC44_02225 [Candidatus Saccharimonadales bacterium]|nr:hypothetical protein [Candidatus Saccharimonadales bacterium]
MAILNIPDSQGVIFRKLSDLTETQFLELIKGLVEARPSLSVESFCKRLSPTVPSIPEDDVEEYVTVLCGLYPAMENLQKSPQRVASDIKETIGEIERFGLSPAKSTLVGARMEKLLSIGKAIAVTAKAFNVATEHQKVFCGVKIYSDIRPIFSSPADSVAGAVVLHNLNISYHEGRNHKEAYFALENSELNDLKVAIERAEKKAKQLQAMLSKSGINYLE